MAQHYRKRPSELLGVEEEYAAYCFDEACFYAQARRAAGEVPVYKTQVRSMSAIYKKIEGDGRSG